MVSYGVKMGFEIILVRMEELILKRKLILKFQLKLTHILILKLMFTP